LQPFFPHLVVLVQALPQRLRRLERRQFLLRLGLQVRREQRELERASSEVWHLRQQLYLRWQERRRCLFCLRWREQRVSVQPSRLPQA
jgi:hypothetical protein